jgi:radical SAM protein with 4Fe4S-binding SPASM domain
MSRKLLDKNFCVLPWTGFELDPDGTVKNCIIAKDKIGDIHKNDIESILHSKENQNIKSQMLSKQYPTSCSGCYFQEKDRATSFDSISSRLYYAKELGTSVDDKLLDDENGFDLRHVDLRWNNKCNQACVYCGPQYSSKWAQELEVKQKVEKENVEKVKQYVFKNIKKLKNVYLAGGEPMLMNDNKEFLTLLLEHNPDVHLRVNTNLSSTKTGVFQLLCKFKNVHWTVSVESMGKEYEYIRHHGSWEDFSKNLKHIQTLDHKISFNMLHFILNYKSIFDCIDYFKSIGFHDNSFIIGPLYGPEYLNIRHLPDNIKQEVVDILEERIGKNTGFYLQNSLENCLKYLTQSNFHANIDTVQNSIQKLDKRRNLNSRKIFPKLYREVLQ